MRILLDTHIFIWWDNQPQQLPADARAYCEDTNNTLVLSVASIWEMQIKQQLGKLALRLPLAELIADQITTNGLEILAIHLAHVVALDGLPLFNKDPFDRVLVAQANSEGLSLLTVDPLFRQYPVKLLE